MRCLLRVRGHVRRRMRTISIKYVNWSADNSLKRDSNFFLRLRRSFVVSSGFFRLYLLGFLQSTIVSLCRL